MSETEITVTDDPAPDVDPETGETFDEGDPRLKSEGVPDGEEGEQPTEGDSGGEG